MAEISQQRIKVDVSYYSEEDKTNLLQLLENNPAKDVMEHFVTNDTEIATADFLAFYLFHLKNRGNPDFENRERIYQNLHKAQEALEGWVEGNGVSIQTKSGITSQLEDIREHIGEGIGLAVASQIHRLILADWARIIPQPGNGNIPRFDFEIASTGDQFIQVENKGSAVADNRSKNEIRHHKSGIKEKKESIASEISKGDYPFPASIRYGTIAAIDPRPGSVVKCWLVDPPAEKVEDNPKRFKLLTRMRFFRDLISFVSPSSQLTMAIRYRIEVLENLHDPFILEKQPLKNKKGKEFEYFTSFFDSSPPKLFSKKSRVTDGPAAGIVIQISDNELFFIGVMPSIISLTASQNFHDILNFKHDYPGTVKKTIKCVFNRREFKQLRLPEKVLKDVDMKKNSFKFYLDGQIHFSSSGLVFGVLPIV